jgi:hypothetical protein
MANSAVKPARCRVCGGPLEQRPVRRPRLVCSRPACRRQAEAESRRRRRRRLAGIAPAWLHDAPQPRGGQGPIARRIARQLAADSFPHVEPTAEEVAALEAVVRLGATPSSLTVTRTGALGGVPPGLPRKARQVLRQLAKRNQEATPPSSKPTLRSATIPGVLPAYEQTDEPVKPS